MKEESLVCPNCASEMIPWGGRVSDHFCRHCGCSFFVNRNFAIWDTKIIRNTLSQINGSEIKAGRKYCPRDGNGLVAVVGQHGPFVTELICHVCGGSLIYPDDLEKIAGISENIFLSQDEDDANLTTSNKVNKTSPARKVTLLVGAVTIFVVSLGFGRELRSQYASTSKASEYEFCQSAQLFKDNYEVFWWCQTDLAKKYQIERISCEGVYLGREIENESSITHQVKLDGNECYLKLTDIDAGTDRYKMIYVQSEYKK